MEEPSRVIVMKFGGTSVADACAVRRLVRHVNAVTMRRAPRARPVVVVSALATVTNSLLSLAKAACEGDRDTVRAGVSVLRALHLRVAAEAAPRSAARLAPVIQAECDKLVTSLETLAALTYASPRLLDAVSGTGELLSSRIAHAGLVDGGAAAAWVDARHVIVTDDHFSAAAPLARETEAAVRRELRPLLRDDQVPVMAGYIAATRNAIMTTLGRGGSDYSAAIVGAALDASEIQIWTDVDGMMTADPRLVHAPRVVPRLTFGEALELAHFGAKVLHPGTIAPAAAKGIQLTILNSRRFDRHGTIISGAPSGRACVAAVACKRAVSLAVFTPTQALAPYDFRRRLIETFESHRTRTDLVTMSEVGVSVIVDDDRRLEAITQSLGDVADVRVERGMAIVGAVGDGLCNEPRLTARVVAAVGALPLAMVVQTASRRGLAVLVRDGDAPAALERLHAELFGAGLRTEWSPETETSRSWRPGPAQRLEL